MNAEKSKVMGFGSEEGLVREFGVDGRQLEHVSEFTSLGFLLDELGRYGMK